MSLTVATGVVKRPKKKEKQKALEIPLPPLLAKNKDNVLLVRERERGGGGEGERCGPSGLGELRRLLVSLCTHSLRLFSTAHSILP